MDQALVLAGHSFAQVWKPLFHAAVFCAAVAIPIEGSAQVVTPKTLPVLQSGQFEMYPSARAGMGGVTIAVDDTLLDPFVNPAKAARIREGRMFASPFLHSISGGRGGGRSLPVGGAGSWGAWSATGMFTFQQLDRAGPTWILSTSDESAFNQYIAGSIARRLSPSTSVGFSAQLASLDAIGGVDLLYAGSDRIEQSGSLADFRLGMTKEMGSDRSLEVVAVHSRTDMRHDVTFTPFTWNPIGGIITGEPRIDRNEDRTHIWGLHSEYTRPVGTSGWRLGWLGTVNRLSHPKIPNYVIQNIPRDPGTTYSFNAGTGIGRTVRGTSFGADLIFEPMFSETWADMTKDTVTSGGGVIRAGDKTIENTFRFSNVKLRFGAGHDFALSEKKATALGVQMGLGLHAINYRLRQTNNIEKSFRTQREDWVEWSPTLGLSFRSRDIDLIYNYLVTCGAGCRDGQMVAPNAGGFESAAGGIIAAPSDRLRMQSGALRVHRFTFSVPIR